MCVSSVRTSLLIKQVLGFLFPSKAFIKNVYVSIYFSERSSSRQGLVCSRELDFFYGSSLDSFQSGQREASFQTLVVQRSTRSDR